MKGPDLAPGEKGSLLIPVPYKKGDTLTLAFTDPFGNMVEDACRPLGIPVPGLPACCAGAPSLREGENSLIVEGDGFRLYFSTETGLITAGYAEKELVLTGGPYLHLTGLALAPWEPESFRWETRQDCAAVAIAGSYGKVRVRFDLRIDRAGYMETLYEVSDMPYASPRRLAMRVGDDTDSGGYEEVGIRFLVPGEMDTLSWNRKGLWDTYPDWHIGRLQGSAVKHNPRACTVPDAAPGGDWQLEERDPVLFGPCDMGRRGTRDFSAMKSHIYRASMGYGKSGQAFTILSDGTDSVRARLTHQADYVIKREDPRVTFCGSWQLQRTGYPSMDGAELWSGRKGDTCTCRFSGTGCAWIASYDILGGMAEVMVDGIRMEDSLSLGVRLLTPGIARGYEWDPGRLVYAAEGLPDGEHTLTITVKGERAPGSMGAYVFVDHFLVFGEGDYGDTQLIIDSEFNYPELSWGCYTKPPVRVSSGYSRRVYTKLGREEES